MSGCLLVLLILYASLHSSYVQTYLVRLFTDKIEQTTGVKIQIGGVDFRPMKSLILNDVLLKDYRNDTLLYCENFRVKIDSFRFSTQSFTVRDITFERAYFNLWIVRGEGEEEAKMNLDVFLNSLQKGSEKHPETLSGSSNWTVNLRKIQVRDSRVVYKENEYEPVDYGINWTDIECRQVNVDITEPDFSGGKFAVRISGLSLEEKSGFGIRDMGGLVTAADSNLLIQECKIYTERSFLDLEKLEFNWIPGRRYWRNFTTKMQQYYRLGNSEVSFIDLAYFNGILRGIDNTVKCRGIVSNTVNRIEGHQLVFALGKDSHFRGSFKSHGLPDVWNTVFEIHLQDAYLSPEDLETIYLPWFEQNIKVPAPLHHLPRFELDGTFKGKITDFIFLVSSRTEGLKGDLKLVYAPYGADSLGCSKISGDFDFPVVHFGKLGGTDLLKYGSMNGNYEGYMDDSHTTVDLWSKMPFLQVGQGKFRNASVSLSVKDDVSNILYSLDNDSVRFTAALNYNPTGGVDFWGAKGFVEVNNLSDFGWALTEGKETVKTDFDLVFAEQNKHNHFFNFTLSDFSYTGPQGHFSLDNVGLENRLDNGYYMTSLLSDVADAQIEGHYTGVYPLAFTEKLIQSYLPAFRQKKRKLSKEENIDFRYDIVVKDVRKVLKALYPQFNISEGSKIAAYYGKDKAIHLKMNADTLQYRDFCLTASEINMEGDAERLQLVYTADKFEYGDMSRLYNVRNTLALGDNNVSNKLIWSNWETQTYSGELSADIRFVPQGEADYLTEICINPGVIILSDNVWQVGKSRIKAEDKEIDIEDFRISKGNQFLSVNGSISKNPEKELSIQVNQFDLAEFSRILTDNRLNLFGMASGEVIVQDYYKDNLLYSDVKVENWGITRDTLGTLRLLSAWDVDSNAVILRAKNEVGSAIPLQVSGYYQPLTDQVNVDIQLSEIGLDRLGRYASDYFTESKGGISGRIRLSGPSAHPDFSGRLFLDSVYLHLRDMNTSFFMNDSIYIDRSDFILKDFVVKDIQNNVSVCSGRYRFWEKRYDLNITSRNFLLLNTSSSQNESFYGTVYISGLTNINNREDMTNITVNVRPEKNSRLFIPLTSALLEEDGNFLHFINPNQPSRRRGSIPNNSNNLTLNANLELNDNLEVQVVFDPTIGDILRTKGNGDIKVTLDQDGLINMFGEYKISKGDYLFTLSNLLNKKFILTPGGSISWNGSPYDATIDINAIYNLKTSLYELLTSSNSNTDRSTKVPVECILNLSDNLTNPLVKFNINFPTLDTQTKGFVQSLFASQDEINKQVFSLLILNKFYTPDYMNSTDMAERNAGYQAGVTTATELVSNQLSRWLSQISNNFDIGFSYRPGDNITTNEIEVALSTQILNDRVTLSANGNVDVGGTKNVTSNSTNSSNIAGDFDVEVKLNKQGTLKLKAYSHTDEKIVYNATETIQGVGVSYQETFDTFRELLHRYFAFLRKKKQ